MSKFKAIALLIVGITMLYAVLAIFVKFVADTALPTNATLDAGSNMTAYPGTSGFLLFSPFLLYVAPAIIGIVWLIVILKRREEGY